MIKNIVFDLGNVLLNVNFDKFKQGLFSEGITAEEFEHFYTIKKKAMGYEKGKIDTKTFLRLCVKKLNYKITQKVFLKCYTEIFTEIKPMKQLVIKISKSRKYRLLLLSNTNPVHYHFVRKLFPFLNLMHDKGLSYRLGYMKPDKRIYKEFVKKFNIKPEESLIVDDLEKNCISAGEFGFNVIHFKGYDDFIKKFRCTLSVKK